LRASVHRVPMGIKPALGWLALLLFTTAAQAEGSRELLKLAPEKARTPIVAPVTPKTKAAPAAVVTGQALAAPVCARDVER
jgi:hypothetical protein